MGDTHIGKRTRTDKAARVPYEGPHKAIRCETDSVTWGPHIAKRTRTDKAARVPYEGPHKGGTEAAQGHTVPNGECHMGAAHSQTDKEGTKPHGCRMRGRRNAKGRDWKPHRYEGDPPIARTPIIP